MPYIDNNTNNEHYKYYCYYEKKENTRFINGLLILAYYKKEKLYQ